MRLECETSFYNDEKLDTDLTHAQETAEEALEQAQQAANTAKNYLYESENKGLVVSREKVESDTEVEELVTPNSRVVADGFDVYKDGTNRVAHFGETTTIGEEGNPQQIIDSDSMTFTTGDGKPVFVVENGIPGNGHNVMEMQAVSDEREYLNQDGTLNTTTLSTLIDGFTSGHTFTSSEYDNVTGTTNVSVIMELSGYGFVDGSSTDDHSVNTTVPISTRTLSEGALTVVTSSELDASDWLGFIDEFVALFPSGTTDYYLWIRFILEYPVSDAQMTLGTRKTGSAVGARSVSIGNANIVSGTGSAAIGNDLIVTDDYSVIVGESNLPIEDANTGDHMPTAFAVGANGTTPFAVLKNGVMIMSAVNGGRAAEQKYNAYTRTDVVITFPHAYPITPFIFLTLNEDNVPNNQNDIIDYGRIQIYLKAVDTTGFTATVVNGSDTNHTFSFSWFAIGVL